MSRGAEAPVAAALSPGLIVDAVSQGRHYRAVTVARPDAAATSAMMAAYNRPGQYLRIAAAGAGDEAPFALAAAPDRRARALELLVRPGAPVADFLAAAGPGDQVLMSDPEGPGYDLEAAAGRDLLALAAGAGIAPIRAALQAVSRRRADFGRVTLLYGQQHSADFAYRQELEQMAERAAVRLVLVVSGADPTWAGARGWVQRVADADPSLWQPGRTRVVVCGMAEMEDEARRIAARRGLAPGDVLTNL